jgi:RNA polymerase sigma-70 factor (ECF subfamily)
MTADEKITDLIHHHQAFCRRIAFHFVQDYDSAEDVVQNAFMKAYLALQRYTPQQQEELQARPWLQKIVCNEARTVLANKRDLLRLAQAGAEGVEGPEEEQPEVVVLYVDEKTALDDLLKLLPRMAQEIIEFWFRFGPSYQEIADALDKDVKTLRTRFHRATQRLKYLVNEKQIRESDMRQWLRANVFALEQEWGRWPRDFSLREYLRSEAYANRFGGHPVRWQFVPEDDNVPDEFLPPSYWN